METLFLASLADNTVLTDILTSFLSIVLEGGPFIFLGTLISGFIAAWLPAHTIDKYLPKNRTAAIFLSGLMGAVLPVCECVVVPVMRRLIRKGLPVSCAVTYMLAAPIVNPITVFSTWKAYQSSVYGGLYISGTRVLLAYMVTVLAGLIIQRISNRKVLSTRLMKAVEGDLARAEAERQAGHHDSSPDEEERESAGTKVVRALRAARRDFLDTAMYFSIGALITAAFSTQFDRQDPALVAMASNEWSGAMLLMVFAFILSLCSTSDAFLSFQMEGIFKISAQMAFMVFGPMMDVKLLFMYSTVFQKRFILVLAIGLFLLIGLLSVVWIYPVR
jgi:uncharacterized membrane protein YraQ (UPF0718 family)